MQYRRGFVVAPAISLALTLMLPAVQSRAQMVMKTEHFDTDPGWDGHNNHSQTPDAKKITQFFGFSNTTRAGGTAGELGGNIFTAGEPAFYGKILAPQTFDDPFIVTGKLNFESNGQAMIGLFNSNTVNEWRTPN